MAGYAWGDKDVVNADPEGSDEIASSYSVDGLLLGIESGWNWQSGDFVAGIEGDLSWMDVDGDGIYEESDPIATDINFLATLTGRLGIARDRVLFYVEGGGAWADEDHTFKNEFGVSRDEWGWLVGAGMAYAINDRWSGKIEYNYIDFGSFNVGFDEGGEIEEIDFDQVVHTIKVGLDYNF
jgi:outer membrane immunogenic protein